MMAPDRDHPMDDLSAYLDGALDPAARASVAEHLRACERCRRVLDDLGVVSTAVREQEVPAVPGELAARVKERVRSDGAPARVIPFRRRLWIPSAAAATIAAVALLAVVTLRQRQEIAPPPLSKSEPPAGGVVGGVVGGISGGEDRSAKQNIAMAERKTRKAAAPRAPAVPPPPPAAPPPPPAAPAPAPPPQIVSTRSDEIDRDRPLMAPRQEERAGAAGGVDSRVVRRMDAPIESTPAKSGFLPCAAGTSYPTGEWTWAVSDRLRALDAIREAIVPLGGSAGVDPARSEIVEIAVEAREAGAAREALERLGAEPPPVLESLPEGERCLRLTVRLTESTPE